MARRTRRGAKRSYTPYMAVGLVALAAAVGYYIVTQSGVTAGSSPLDGTAVPSNVLAELADVSPATLNYIGPGAAGATTAAGNTTTLTLNGKPEVLYIGAEYCPYCASERWAMIVALDKFGNFTGIEYMQSSATDVYPNTPTFTFVHANYTSNYISFVSVEQEDRFENPLQTPTSAQSALMSSYDSGGSIPFVDFGNRYTLTGAQMVPTVYRFNDTANGAPYNWTVIAGSLNTETSTFAQNIDGAANRLIAAICNIDGAQPKSICSQTLAATAGYVVPAGHVPLLSELIATTPAQTAFSRYAPSRFTVWL